MFIWWIVVKHRPQPMVQDRTQSPPPDVKMGPPRSRSTDPDVHENSGTERRGTVKTVTTMIMPTTCAGWQSGVLLSAVSDNNSALPELQNHTRNKKKKIKKEGKLWSPRTQKLVTGVRSDSFFPWHNFWSIRDSIQTERCDKIYPTCGPIRSTMKNSVSMSRKKENTCFFDKDSLM